MKADSRPSCDPDISQPTAPHLAVVRKLSEHRVVRTGGPAGRALGSVGHGTHHWYTSHPFVHDVNQCVTSPQF
jgi:hypothetical protein